MSFDTLATHNRHLRWNSWFSWVVFSFIGAIVGVLLTTLIAEALLLDMLWQMSWYTPPVGSLIMVGTQALIGACVGIAQRWVINDQRQVRWWVSTTAVGGACGGVLFHRWLYYVVLNQGWYNDRNTLLTIFWLQGALLVFTTLVITGFLQGILLWRRGERGIPWIVASTIGAVVGGMLSGTTYLDATDLLDWSVAWGLGWLGWAVVTGLVLRWFPTKRTS